MLLLTVAPVVSKPMADAGIVIPLSCAHVSATAGGSLSPPPPQATEIDAAISTAPGPARRVKGDDKADEVAMERIMQISWRRRATWDTKRRPASLWSRQEARIGGCPWVVEDQGMNKKPVKSLTCYRRVAADSARRAAYG